REAASGLTATRSEISHASKPCSSAKTTHRWKFALVAAGPKLSKFTASFIRTILDGSHTASPSVSCQDGSMSDSARIVSSQTRNRIRDTVTLAHPQSELLIAIVTGETNVSSSGFPYISDRSFHTFSQKVP